jgi:quercetin dioxygenase-like cupin family protein
MTTPSNQYLKDELADRATVFEPGQGKVLNIKGGRITFKVTSSISNDQLGVYEIYLEPGTVGAQLHYHRYMDETFVVTEGTLAVTHGRAKVSAKAGSVIHVPRFTPHAFANESDKPVTVMLVFNPAQGREGFFYGLQQILNAPSFNPAEFLALYQKYDSFPVEAAKTAS